MGLLTQLFVVVFAYILIRKKKRRLKFIAEFNLSLNKFLKYFTTI